MPSLRNGLLDSTFAAHDFNTEHGNREDGIVNITVKPLHGTMSSMQVIANTSDTVQQLKQTIGQVSPLSVEEFHLIDAFRRHELVKAIDAIIRVL